MFNLGIKKDLIQRLGVDKAVNKRTIVSGEVMNAQVKKVLEQKGLILMARG
jgi:hypothetical protein